ncbi:MAG: hypothetical protein ABSD46_12575 [Bacteroidota bacterium]
MFRCSVALIALTIDIFLELIPSLQLTSSSGFGVDAGIGGEIFLLMVVS